MRILVIGGTGFLGSRVVTALRRIGGADVVVGSRRRRNSGVQIDLADRSSHAQMTGFDIVVNCADTLDVSPARAAEFCLFQGITFVETSADVDVIEELFAAVKSVPDPKGAVVISAGLFPGLSNMLAAKVCRENVPRRLEVGVCYNPLSQAGRGVCRLMARAASRPAARFEGGARVHDHPVTVGGTLPFSGRESHVMGVGLPESLMLHWSRGVASTGSFLAPIPPVPVTIQRLVTLCTPWRVFRWRPVQSLLAAGIGLLRRCLFRWHRAGVQITAVRDRDTSGQHGGGMSCKVACGFTATAYAIAACVATWVERDALAPGVHLIDDAASFDDVVARMCSLSDGDVSPEVTVEPAKADR